ncbi:beta-lactamase/transpeptidase-like protein [Triangularia verruculosa]|uniref:Beta-lactamase/transpeptidase-like protein n=1 Tax=Triangularia verruculosa TaxID=2587418 RepID=A0AAN6XKQ5_9PEZI|nr:beta-lactamase/transpeptidase-like protein [Triangularia verruculosa]
MESGVPVYHAHFGHRDVDTQLPVTADTIFPACSIVKAITAAAVGILVEKGKLSWDTLFKDIIPSFHSGDEILQNCLTVTDLLSYRSGMAWADNLVIGTENNILIAGEDGVKYINSQKRLLPFRAQWAYNNLPYDLAGNVIEELSGQSYFDFVQDRILNPLRLERTSLKPPSQETDNVTSSYNALDDAIAVRIPCPKAGSNRFAGPSGGLWSSMSDLLKLYKAFGASLEHQFATGLTSTPDNPFKQVAYLTSAKIPMDQPSKNELSYACGWGRAQLPNRLGQIGINPGLLPEGMPTVGKGTQSQLVIVVLSNSLALTDVSDWVGQLVLEELLEVPASERIDVADFARTTVVENLKWYPALVKELDDTRKPGSSPKYLEEYVGVYWMDIGVFKIVVTLEEGSLYWAIQGLDSEKFKLNHYDDDTFTWLLPRNELSRRGRWVGGDQGPDFWKAVFKVEAGLINKLYWAHDTSVPPLELTKEKPGRDLVTAHGQSPLT